MGVYRAWYLKEVVVMEERSVILQLPLLSLFHLVLPLLFQFCYALKAAQRIVRHSRVILHEVICSPTKHV